MCIFLRLCSPHTVSHTVSQLNSKSTLFQTHFILTFGCIYLGHCNFNSSPIIIHFLELSFLKVFYSQCPRHQLWNPELVGLHELQNHLVTLTSFQSLVPLDRCPTSFSTINFQLEGESGSDSDPDSDILQAIDNFFVNKYVDHHANEIAFYM